MRKQWLFAALALAAGSAFAQSPNRPELPPGHPPIDGTSQKPAPELPVGHPPIDGTSSQPAPQLPSGHPAIKPGAEARNADDLLNKLDSTTDLKQRVKTFEIAASIGRLYYSRSRYSDAAAYFAIALEKAEPSRQLYLQERKKAGPKALSQKDSCPKDANDSLEHQTSAAQAAVKAGRASAALSCLRDALQPVLEIGELRGNALFLTGNPSGAAEQYERVLQVSEERPDSLFGHGAVLLDSKGDDLSSLRRAKSDFEKYLRLYANLPRAEQAKSLLARVEQALSAGGITKLAQKRAQERKSKVAVSVAPTPNVSAPFASSSGSASGPSAAQPTQLTQEMIDAVKNTERTPELEQGLAKLVQDGEDHLAHARYQEALDAYKRVVPFQPDNGRAKAGMAWALVGLNRQPMADRVWSVAVQGDPAAIDKLGEALSAKGDKQGAKALWTKLASSAPDYAQKAGLKNKIQ
jgi:tetratricopeptide (TPR) repeat protein